MEKTGFTDEGVFSERTIPTEIQNNLPRLDSIMRERFSLPIEWEVYRWERLGHDKNGNGGYGLEVEGGVPRILKRGKRKGQKTWRDAQMIRNTTLTFDEIETWYANWESRTGFCCKCDGSGRTLKSFGVGGTTYRTCASCSGSGRAALSKVEG